MIDGDPFAGLVAHYTMDTIATTAPEMPDATTHHAGTCTSCPTVVAGMHGQAYQFTGGTEIIHVAGTGELRTTAGFTVGAWFQFAAPHLGCFINKIVGTAAQDSWQACVQTSGVVAFYTNGPAGSGSLASGVVTTNVWHHIALVWDGMAKSLFIDGTLSASIANSPTSFDDGDVLIGADLDDNALVGPYSGLLDDVEIYDRALDPAAIAVLATP
jgi:hypothetical protein